MTTGATPATATTPNREYTQARIRANQEGAQLLWRLVLAEETRLLTQRRQGTDIERQHLQRDLKAIRRVKDEIERVLIENDWAD